MKQIEELYYKWQENSGPDPEEFRRINSKINQELDRLIGSKKAGEIDEMYTDCLNISTLEAFKAGFRQATLLWKECL